MSLGFLKFFIERKKPDGKAAIVMITDSCPSCHSKFDLDLSTQGWNQGNFMISHIYENNLF